MSDFFDLSKLSWWELRDLLCTLAQRTSDESTLNELIDLVTTHPDLPARATFFEALSLNRHLTPAMIQKMLAWLNRPVPQEPLQLVPRAQDLITGLLVQHEQTPVETLSQLLQDSDPRKRAAAILAIAQQNSWDYWRSLLTEENKAAWPIPTPLKVVAEMGMETSPENITEEWEVVDSRVASSADIVIQWSFYVGDGTIRYEGVTLPRDLFNYFITQ
jgi:hypothetical protein